MNDKSEIKRWLGIDYGEVRVGVAISDPLGYTARGLETIKWNGNDMTKVVQRIFELVENYAIEGIVIGIPRRTDGKPGQSEDNAKKLSAALAEQTGITPVHRDERYTTVLASRVMRETNVARSRRKGIVDQIAAEIILQEYLESLRKQT